MKLSMEQQVLRATRALHKCPSARFDLQCAKGWRRCNGQRHGAIIRGLSLSAVASSKRRETSKCPLKASTCKEVIPSCSLAYVHIGLQQKACNLQVSAASCDEQRGEAIMRGLVIVRIGLQQKACNFQLPVLSCYEQRGGSMLHCLVLVCI